MKFRTILVLELTADSIAERWKLAGAEWRIEVWKLVLLAAEELAVEVRMSALIPEPSWLQHLVAVSEASLDE